MCSVDGPVIRTHRCTMWKHCDYCCLLLANVVGQHYVMGEILQIKENQKHPENSLGSFPFQFTAFSQSHEEVTPLFNNPPLRTRSETNANRHAVSALSKSE